MGQYAFYAVFMRGGTSKGLFMHSSDLPTEESERDALILAAMGSPDPFERQLDGMGGGISSLSKVMIVDRSARPNVDIEYRFGQVSITQPTIHYRWNCGNLTAAVAAFAVDEGLVKCDSEVAQLRMLSLNTGKIVRASVNVHASKSLVDGQFVIDGVAGAGAPIRLDFLAPAGTEGGTLLPTGSLVDVIEVKGVGRIRATIMDAGGVVVFVSAEAVGLSGREMPIELQANTAAMARLDAVSAEVATRIGSVLHTLAVHGPGFVRPSITLVASRSHQSISESRASIADKADIDVRNISMGVPHRAMPVSVAICAAVAASVEGTIVHEQMQHNIDGRPIRIGHPAGLLPVDAVISKDDGLSVESVTVYRTARRLMSGLVHVPRSLACPPSTS